MLQRPAFASLLLLTSHFVAPAALAQVAGGSPAGQSSPPASTTGTEVDAPANTAQDRALAQPGTTADQQGADQQEPAVEVSTPGYDPAAAEDIVVVGRNIPNTIRATPQVISVLSAADIARTGEGDIAGALTRVTGLSVVGNGFVYVRGLGDRYSSALLNGSPLPSPEPLRRSVPLDIFPTTIVGSALVQKTYSVNYPGEFGGGVINLTTKAIPDKSFVSMGGTISADTVTTSELGYTYKGGKHDWIGFDSGERRVPKFITDAPGGNGIIPTEQVAQLSNARTTLLQRNNQLPANGSGEVSFGIVKDVGSDRLGVIGSASISNSWRTRDATQQDTISANGALRNDFSTLITDNRAVVNALLGLGYEFGKNTIRLTNIYIHDTLKQARGSAATVYNNSSGAPIFQQNTNWFERQLIESQLVGEFKPFDRVQLDVRGAYANSKRLAPYERQFIYLCNTSLNVTVTEANAAEGIQCPGAYQATNAFDRFATVVFSRLNENLYTAQADASWRPNLERPMTLSAGYYFQKNDRSSTRLPFVFQTTTGGAIPFPCNLFRPDFLLSPDVLNGCPVAANPAQNAVQLRFDAGQNGSYAYDASLLIHAGYAQVEAEATDGLRATIGLRYETAKERVDPINATGTRLNNDYFLPAATLTWNFASDMQLRASASKTIARPQFRELAPQAFRDFESDRLFFGNPFLKDSKLYNLEARYEWFFARDQRATLSGFYKRIDNPIEQVGFFPTPDARLQTGFTYLPKATLWGAEAEVQKYVPLTALGGLFETRRAVIIANYTYTQSKITANAQCVPSVLGVQIAPCGPGFAPANVQFRNGAPLTGQSDHLVNLQLGVEDTDSLSAITLLFNYASNRVTNRGPSYLSGTGFQPDIIERPGIRLDLVARQGVEAFGGQFEIKAEARNLTGTRYQERQDFETGNTVFINRYRQGRIFTLGASVTF
ncbi:outer membrane receptor protein involved in Fe transport [Sphingomonas sp. SORGH_AS802]|uniref:TonB-dependent receptor domain-containing protein n=1 Tax=unclassified Sphingomonas TaxID=196159 RepID=UPI0028584DCE|nr:MULTISPECIES: TonB-dependent receptor [unclassified Sphingomonas]MDR6126887.1 outer membrane receptor protein involved in Fe transport [Sphingomonas sp. SORGH_AS_0438]MDR6134751.1 outer membrane receptor protein involved in Fe transport [Sphingomonas sp. SORGH_AS_0802]